VAVKSGSAKEPSLGKPQTSDAVDPVLLDAVRSRILKRLAGTLRHDLNSPLQAALWSLDLLERGIGSHPDAEQRAKLLTSLELGRRELARLQGAVRIFTACAAPLEEETSSFDLRDVLKEVERLTAAEASLRDIQMTMELPADALDFEGRRGDIQQALLMLALEALEHTAPGGRLVVSVRDEQGRIDTCFAYAGAERAAENSSDEVAHAVMKAIAAAHRGDLIRRESNARRESHFILQTRSTHTAP
jgi:signal transduction histidine kinase